MATNPLDNPDVKNNLDDTAEKAKEGADKVVGSVDNVLEDVLEWTKDFIMQSWELIKSFYESLF